MVSRLFGKLEVRRHLMVGSSAAMAGAARVVAAPAAAPVEAFSENHDVAYCLLKGKYVKPVG
jgi:hypothetical protein